MDKSDTIIVVGITELDEYNNLWITPQGGGDKVKIGAKREHLHPLFEQGKAVLLHWETYRNRTYVADAKLVEGELPPPKKPYEAPVIIQPAKSDRDSVIEAQVAIKSITELWAAGKLAEDNSLVVALKIWLSEKLNPYMMPIAVESQEEKQTKSKLTTEDIQSALDTSTKTITEPQTFPELRQWAIGVDKSYTLTWMVNTVKIPEAELRAKPNECFHKIKKFIEKEG